MSVQVAQQEMFEPPARRRLIVPAGNVNVWGVDPGSKRAALATVTPELRRGWDLVVWPELRGVQRLDALYKAAFTAAADLAGLLPPGLICVERMVAPKKQGANVELIAIAGVTYAGVYAGACSVMRVPPHVTDFVPGAWKKLACGRGDIYKPTRAKLGRPVQPADYGVLAWARDLGYPGDSWDVADAMGMAEAGRRDFVLEVR